MNGLVFDEREHAYTLDGQRLISVTQLIDSCGLVAGKEFFRPEHADRGTAVHMAIHFLDEGTLDWETVDPRIAPYIRGYERFMRETQFESYLSECRLASRRHFYAGTFDRLGWMHSEEFTLVDFKSGQYSSWMDLQLELYSRLLEENREELALDALPEKRILVQLKPDGSYKIHHPTLRPHLVQKLTDYLLTINHFREGRLAA